MAQCLGGSGSTSLSYSSDKTRLAFLSFFDEQSVYLLRSDDELCPWESEGLVNPERFGVARQNLSVLLASTMPAHRRFKMENQDKAPAPLVAGATFGVSIRLCLSDFVLPSVPLRGLSLHRSSRAKIRITLAGACALGWQVCPSFEPRDLTYAKPSKSNVWHLKMPVPPICSC